MPLSKGNSELNNCGHIATCRCGGALSRSRPLLRGKVCRTLCLVILMAFVSVNLPPARGQSRASAEYEVKAAFLYNFAKFVDWPPGAFRAPEEGITFCVYGEDPFEGALERVIAGKTIRDRPLRVLRPKQTSEFSSCRILFIASSERKRLPQVLSSVHEAPILTVGEVEHFIQAGGMIGFVINENKVRFEINLKATEESHLSPSSKLLALATSVISSSRAGPD